MPHIVLNEEQAKVVTSALQPVQVRDAKGNVLGTIPPIWTEEDIAEAKRILQSLQQHSKTTYVPPFLLAAIYLGLRDNDTALAMLEKSYKEHDWGLIWIHVAPKFDVLRSSPRFRALEKEMKFPPKKP